MNAVPIAGGVSTWLEPETMTMGTQETGAVAMCPGDSGSPYYGTIDGVEKLLGVMIQSSGCPNAPDNPAPVGRVLLIPTDPGGVPVPTPTPSPSNSSIALPDSATTPTPVVVAPSVVASQNETPLPSHGITEEGSGGEKLAKCLALDLEDKNYCRDNKEKEGGEAILK